MRIAAAAIVAIIAAVAPSAPTARQQFEDMQARIRTAIKAGDQQSRIATDQELLRFLHGSPDALLALARAYVAAGDATNAVATLNRIADMGLAADNLMNGSDKAFSSLQSHPEYKGVLERFRQNQQSVSLGATAITLTDPGLLTEDIDFDPSTHTFLITSVLEHKIIRAGLDGRITDFSSSPDRWPMLAIKLDAPRNRVWATEVALDGFTSAPKEAWGRSAVLCYDLKSGKLLRRIEGPPKTALGDMVLTPDGEPILSDGQGGKLYRLIGDNLRPIESNEFISPQTPARTPGGDAILVPDYLRGIGLLNLSTQQVSWLDGSKIALNGVDGLYLHGRSLILTQNGTSPQRVLRLELDASLTRITNSKVIDQSPAQTDPTHGVVVGNDFYYIANSGWGQLDDHGDVKPGSRLTSARIMHYSLK
ncbi:hypothetical protein [Occallatibacter riparius]|uniref:Tetratricopeptide repeat protein n=1 Tax=Occallatibacter riparius TaxID=1002689 RepID=A0A9J7BK72_9BACT|nr:hypothetical protein [Occallatibacter riparius]UWZ83063.1 hypothetical protein MOP44_21140 [Occallatibacter riparius]